MPRRALVRDVSPEHLRRAAPFRDGALLWHGLIDIDKGIISVSRKGQQLLALWHPTAQQKA